jgi:Tetratricopeptide repeat
MATYSKFVSLFLTFISLAPLCHSQSLSIQEDLKAGISAYDKSAYDEAISHLSRVVSLDSRQIEAHFYLAMSYDQKFVPNAETEYDNTYWLRRALNEYQQVLALDPEHKGALLRIAYIFFVESRDDESEQYYRKVLEIDQEDPEAMYLLAIIDFKKAYRARIEERSELKLPRKTPFIDSATCYSVRGKNLANVQEGIELLERSLEFTKNGKYDVQIYLSLFYVERADIQCQDQQAYGADLRVAEKWRLASEETLRQEEHEPQPTPPRWPPSPPPAPESYVLTKSPYN